MPILAAFRVFTASKNLSFLFDVFVLTTFLMFFGLSVTLIVPLIALQGNLHRKNHT